MIDYLSFALPISYISESDLSTLMQRTDLSRRITPYGEERSWSGDWNSLRSDDAGVALKLNDRQLTFNGSPASIVYPNNVFGSNDIKKCFHSMADFIDENAGISLDRNYLFWKLIRIDYTNNYDLGGQIAVTQAIEFYKNVPTRGNNVR